MTEQVRAFVAIELSTQAREALGELVQALSRARLRGVRLVRPEGVHLTLKFLGVVQVAQVDAITSALARVASAHTPFVLGLSGAGVFPERSAPRVLWVGIEGDVGPLRSLQRDVEAALEALGFPREERGFQPHLTIGRIKEGTPPAERREAERALMSAWASPRVPIEVGSVSLMKSILKPDGAIYQRLASVTLGSGSGEGTPK